jgi:hypothetical protein
MGYYYDWIDRRYQPIDHDRKLTVYKKVWLPPEQAERLAAEILSARFKLPSLQIIAPRKKRRKPAYIAFVSAPRELGPRPRDFSQQVLDTLGPIARKKAVAGRKREQEQWDRWWARSKERKLERTGPWLIPGWSRTTNDGRSSLA